MSRKDRELQTGLWIAATEVATAPGNPFYQRLNRILTDAGFDPFGEDLCARFYKEGGRPSIAPGVYFRMRLIGYLEGLDSERGIAWRCADSLGLREFLGFPLTQATPDHSSLSIIRRRFDLEAHRDVFCWVLRIRAEAGWLKGKTLGVDSTTLEAHAAMRSMVRRDTGESYEAFLTRLAKASGLETPQREDLAKLDRERPQKGSNQDWESPSDPDARITKMKDGRAHLAHKAEHAVDLETGAVGAVTLQPADQGDTQTLLDTLAQACENVFDLPDQMPMAEVVADQGYHRNETVSVLAECGVRSYLSEPKRGRRQWDEKQAVQQAVYAHRRRRRGERGKRLWRSRGELLERPFAHGYETGAMRRTHLRGRENILKRLLVHVAACNLGLVTRTRFGFGTPRGLSELLSSLLATVFRMHHRFQALWMPFRAGLLSSGVPQNILAAA